MGGAWQRLLRMPGGVARKAATSTGRGSAGPGPRPDPVGGGWGGREGLGAVGGGWERLGARRAPLWAPYRNLQGRLVRNGVCVWGCVCGKRLAASGPPAAVGAAGCPRALLGVIVAAGPAGWALPGSCWR